MSYTTIDKPSDYFNIKLYTGTGSSNSITGIGFAPDWVWIKNRGLTAHHMLFDTVRGATKVLYSNLNDAETTVSGHVTSFDSDGFTLGDNSGKGSTNGNTETYVAWNWLAGGSASSNTDGSITSSVSANTTAGFSILTWTGTGSNATLGHGLGATPKLIFCKRRSSTKNWINYDAVNGATKFTNLNDTPVGTSSSVFNNTEPTTSVFSVGTNTHVNESSATYVAYCFAEKQGYSKIGSYTGNSSSDGTFLYLGFKPALAIIKDITSTDPWHMIDNKRSPINLVNARLFPNSNNAENTSADICDFVSNGIKFRGTNDGFNGSRNYLYYAVAESPFVNSKGVPNNAR